MTKRTLKNGKTLEFYDIKADDDSKMLDCKARYEGEEFQLSCYSLTLNKADIQNPGYDPLDKSTQKFSPYANPETYFPALTATKKVNDLIQKYKDPSKSMLPENVDKTSELYLDMKSCADEAIKDCKTEYEKIITLDKYVHSIISYDLSCKGYSLEKSWEEKKGVCGQYAEIMVRLCQIEGIPSSYVESLPKEKKGHACVFSYDSQNKKWILSDPTNYVADWDVYSWANQVDMIFIDNNYLKKDNCYFSLDYDKNNPNNATDKNTWDEMENWGLNLQKFDLSNGSDIVVPNDIDGVPVTYVRGLTADLTSIKLPNSLIKIKDDAFNSMDTLKSLVIDRGAPNLNELGERSFSGCSNIEELDLSNSKLTSIPEGAFAYCKNLKTIKLPSTITSIGDEAFYNCQSLTNIEGLDKCNLKSIGSAAFSNCKSLENLDFSQSTFTNVPSKAFYGCSALAKITLPDTLTTIGGYAFYACYGMPQLDLSNTALTTLENYALYQMRETTKLSLPDSISSIGTHAFSVSTSNGAVPTILPASLKDKVNYKDAATSPWLNRKVMFTDENVKTIHFYGNGATIGDTEPMFVSEGSKVTLPSCGFSKTNYIFKGWNTKADGTGESYKPNATLTTIPSKLYAQWAKTSYKVNLVYTGGTIKINGVNHTNNYTMTCTFKNASTTYSLPTTSQVMRPGYKFVAWYDNEECTGKILTKITIDNVSDMTLYAKWRIDPNHNHQWDKGRVTKEPSCKEEGEILYTCSVCKGTKVEALAKTDNHQWGEWITTTKPTCSTKGKEIRTCKVCSKTEEKAIPTIPHTVVKEADKAATCTEDGYKGREYCSVCNTTIKERTVIPATGHDVKLVGAKDSTCTSKGYSGNEVCKTCGKTIKTGHELPLAQHTPKKEEGVAATCTKDGHEGNTVCEVCKQVITTGKVIPKLGHDWSNEDGKCTRCGESHEHSYGEGTTIKGLTCTQDEEIDYTCSECGYVKKEITKATGHEWGEWQTTLAQTCTTDGKEERTCAKCSEKEERTLKAIGHEWGEWKITLAQTCTTDGKEERTCAKCSKKEERTLKATGHKSETVGAKAPTCKEDGYTGDEVCKVCHETLNKGTTIPKTNSHEWGKWTTVREATCTEKGEQIRKCAVCREEEIESLPLAKHSWDNGKVTKAPSYKATGVKTWTCKKCGKTKTTTLAKLPMPKAGTKVMVGGNQYTVTKAGSEVCFSKANAKARATAVPSTIKAKGITYKVTSIGANAFKNCKKLTKATIGANVMVIKAKAFKNCPKLKTVTIKTVLLTKKTASKKCFSKVSKRMVIKSPKKVKKTYIVIFKDLKVR
ncbi:leucine-rich repeat protein [Anaerobutyricum hallii]|uniref:leucine-rich repeat protein n=1 Tax=Anaerobutyricum hallii TaxID=39488 RepID=UPI00242F8641|nr:leucine-rich repeat protein [Anaerobutyricum hallii]